MSDEGYDRALEIAQSIFDRVRAAQRGDNKGLALPDLKVERTIDGKKCRVGLPLASEANLVKDAEGNLRHEAYKFGSGVMYSKSRKTWVPSFRVFTPFAPIGKTEHGRRFWTGARAVQNMLNEAVADQDDKLGNPYFSTVSEPKTRMARIDADKLNGQLRQDKIFPGAGCSATVRGPFSTVGYFVALRDEVNKRRGFRMRAIKCGDAVFQCMEPAPDGESNEDCWVVERKALDDGSAIYAVLSGHGATRNGEITPTSSFSDRSQFRVWDEAPSANKYTPKIEDAFGHLVGVGESSPVHPRINEPQALDIAHAALNHPERDVRPSLLPGNEDGVLKGVVMNPFESIPGEGSFDLSDAPKTDIPVRLRGLGSGVSQGRITCVRTAVTALDYRNVPLEYSNMIEIVGTSGQIGVGADSGGPVVVEASDNTAYLLGTIALGAERVYEMSGYLGIDPKERVGAAYASVAKTQLDRTGTVLVVD